MGKRKVRVNGMDLVILAVILAAVALLLYVFVWSDESTDASQTQYTDITYVVEIKEIDERYAGMVKVGQQIEDAVKHGALGTVAGVEVQTTLVPKYDETTGKEVYSPVPGKINLYITVTAEAAISSLGYSVSGEMIRVGKHISMQCPELLCHGYCIKLDVAQ